MADWDLLNLTIAQHTPYPIYPIQEHPLVHGIVCFKDKVKLEMVYMLYRHNDNPVETILARIDTGNNKVDILHGSDTIQDKEIEQFAHSTNFVNNTSPLYNCLYTQSIAPYSLTTLILNRERELFTKAKILLMAELNRQQSDSNNYSEIIPFFTKLYEA